VDALTNDIEGSGANSGPLNPIIDDTADKKGEGEPGQTDQA